jgi:hypothetical protein
MKKIIAMVAAALVLAVVLAVPALAQQTSGPATGAQAVNAALAGNVCVQQAENVNSGNVDIDQAANNINAQVGFAQTAVAEPTGENAEAVAVNEAKDVNVTQNQTVTQNIAQTAHGIEQVNNALQICNQAFTAVR